MRFSSFNTNTNQEQRQENIEEPFFKHAREENKLNCIQIYHGLLISLMMVCLQFTGDYLGDINNNNIQLPDTFTRSSFSGCWHLADYFEPLYMFWIGFNIQMSINQNHKRTLTLWGSLFLKFFSLLFFGFFVNSIICGFEYSQFRMMGFFQRVIIINFFMLILHLYADKKVQYFVVIIFSLASIGITTTVKGKLIDCPHVNVKLPQCNGISYLDYSLFGSNHMQYKQYDEDGLFSILNIILIVYVGYSFGSVLKVFGNKNVKRVLIYWFIFSLILVFIGLITYIQWTFIPPVYLQNFTMFCSGLSGIVLLFLYIIVDLSHKKYPIFTKISNPFIWFGKNGLFLFGVRCLIESIFLKYNLTLKIVNKIGFFSNDSMNGLFYNLLFYLLFLLISFLLHKTNICFRF
ncbi:hypothetical protein ABPG72_003907 [Tetrahymena utriculariae]